jgi:hypothetical protein
LSRLVDRKLTIGGFLGGVGEGIGDQVDRLGGVLGEDDLVGPCADEGSNRRPRGLVGLGALLGERVGATVRCGVETFVPVTLGVEHLARLLRGRARVEVDQRPVVTHGARQDREVGPDRGDLLLAEGSGRHTEPQAFVRKRS